MGIRLRTVSWPAIVGGGAILPLLPGLLPGRTLAWRDSALLHGPVRGLVVDALRSGTLPLWNPYAGTGEPLLAQAMHAALHPVSVATAMVSPSIDALLVAFVVVAALGAWMAARVLGVKPAPAAVAGFGYGLSGYVLGMTGNAGYLAGASTLPWVVAGLVHAANHRGGWIAGACAVAAAALAGDPGVMVAGLAIGVVLGVAGHGWKAGVRMVGAILLGTAGAAIQILPTWTWIGETTRSVPGFTSRLGEQWPLDVTRLPELLSPGLFVGMPRSYRSPVFEAFGSAAQVPFPWAPSVYIGAPLLALSSMAFRRRRSVAIVLLVLAVIFGWVALGRAGGASQLLQDVPVWGSLRYWEKMMAPVTLLVALAAAIGADGLGAEDGPVLRRRAVWGAVVLLAAAGFAATAARTATGASATYASRLALGLAFAAALLFVLAWLAALAATGKRDVSPLLAALVFVQSVAATPFAIHVGESRALEARPPELTAGPPGPRILTPVTRDFEEGAGGWDAIDRTHALLHRIGWPAANVAARMENAESYTGFGSARSVVVSGARHLKWPLLRRLGATHVVAPPPEDDEDRRVLALALGPGSRLVESGPDGVKAWEVKHRERAVFAGSARIAPDIREAARALGAVVADDSPEVVLEAPALPPTGPGRVLSVQRRPARVDVTGECQDRCLLVLNEAWAPGWVAEIDGASVPVYPVDVVARAIPWPAGSHHMVMRYEPPEVALGITVSATAWVIVALGVLACLRRSAGRPAS